MRNDGAYLLDILSAAQEIEEFTIGLSYADFLQDKRTLRAVEKSFEVLGEAARCVSAEFRGDHPELPWTWMIGIRNVIVHQYFQINYAVIWQTIADDIPELIRLIEPLVPPED